MTRGAELIETNVNFQTLSPWRDIDLSSSAASWKGIDASTKIEQILMHREYHPFGWFVYEMNE
jgi:hypothetical protein